MVKPTLPNLDGLNRIDSMETGEAIRALNNTMKMLTKELEHAFYNLDDENFNEVEWNNITSPIYAQIEDNKENIATLQLVADRFDLMVSGIGADGQVTAASIVAAINGTSGESMVKISADHIDISGEVQFLTPDDVGASGTTVISGSRITTGTIDASKVTVSNLNASNITTGSLSANRISGGTIDASDIESVNITSCTISGGTYTVTGSDSKMVIKNGLIYFYNAGATSNFGYIYYYDNTNQLFLGCNNDIKLEASDNISIEMGNDLYIQADNFVLGNQSATFYVPTRIYENASFGNSKLDVTVWFYGTVNFTNATVVGL